MRAERALSATDDHHRRVLERQLPPRQRARGVLKQHFETLRAKIGTVPAMPPKCDVVFSGKAPRPTPVTVTIYEMKEVPR